MERKRVYKGVPDEVYDAAFGAPSKVISEDVREAAISEALATAMRGQTAEMLAEKQQMSELLPALTEAFSVTMIGQAKPTGASLDWWSSENGVPKALQRAGAWGSVGASMVCSYPSDLLVCDRTAVLPQGRCRRTGDTWLPVELKTSTFNVAHGAWMVNRCGWASPSRVGNVVILQLKPPAPMPERYNGGHGSYVFLAESAKWLKSSLKGSTWVPNRSGRQLTEMFEGAWCRAGEEVCSALKRIFGSPERNPARYLDGVVVPATPVQQAAFKSLHIGCCSVGTRTTAHRNPRASFTQEEFDEMVAGMEKTHQAEMEAISANFGPWSRPLVQLVPKLKMSKIPRI